MLQNCTVVTNPPDDGVPLTWFYDLHSGDSILLQNEVDRLAGKGRDVTVVLRDTRESGGKTQVHDDTMGKYPRMTTKPSIFGAIWVS